MNIENLKKILNSKDDFKAFLMSKTREDSLKYLNDHGVDVKDEELEPVLEKEIRAMGIEVTGKDQTGDTEKNKEKTM